MALVEPIGKFSFLEISSFLGDLGPDHVTGRLGWLEWVESKEIAAWDDWNQLPSNSRSSSTPAACHLADVPGLAQDVACNLYFKHPTSDTYGFFEIRSRMGFLFDLSPFRRGSRHAS